MTWLCAAMTIASQFSRPKTAMVASNELLDAGITRVSTCAAEADLAEAKVYAEDLFVLDAAADGVVWSRRQG